MPRIPACGAPLVDADGASCGPPRGAGGAAAGRGRPGRRPRRATRRPGRRAARRRRCGRAGWRRRRSAAPGASSSAAAASSDRWKVPLAGETTIRQVGRGLDLRRPRRASRRTSRASSSWSGVLSANVSTPLQRALGDAGEGAGGRHLEDAGDAEVGHGLHAEVPAHRAGDLADDPGEHVAAVVDDLAVVVGDQRGARVVGRDRAGQRGRGGRRRAPCARCGRRRRR